MNEKGQEKEGFGCTVPRALSLIHKQTYLGMWLQQILRLTSCTCSFSVAQPQSGAWTEPV